MQNTVDKVREIIALKEDNVEEKKMFGGICFMVNDKMCVCVRNERLMLRIDPAIRDGLLEQDGCSPMVHNGRNYDAYMCVDETAVKTKKQLEYWVNLSLDYNKVAKPSKKKRK